MRRLAILVGFLLAVTVALRADADTSRTDAQTLTDQQTLLVNQTFKGTPVIVPLQRLFYENAGGERCAVGGQFPIETVSWRSTLPLQVGEGKTCEDRVPVRICATESPSLEADDAVCSARFTLSPTETTVKVEWPESANRRVITTHFVHDGVSEQVTIRGWSFLVGGQLCRSGGIYALSGPKVTVKDVSRFWSAYSQYDRCATLGQDVTARYDTVEYGTLSGTFSWQGLDSEFSIETGDALPVPTPSPVLVPGFSSTITVRHMFRGVPILKVIDHRLNRGDVNGYRCGYYTSTDVQFAYAIVSRGGWPLNEQGQCNTVGFPSHICVDGRDCSEEFVYGGDDATVDVNYSESELGMFPFATAHFRRNGGSTLVTILSLKFTAAGESCFKASWPQWGGDTPAATVSDLGMFYPFGYASCRLAGTAVTATFDTAEFGELQTTFTWTGIDMDYDVIIPSAETPSPEPTVFPTPTATPASLPHTGGSPPSAPGMALEVVALGGLAMAAGGALLLRRRRSG